jgi:hypothetical protein
VTLDPKVAPVEYNYRDKAEMEARKGPNGIEGEEHGLSVFFRRKPIDAPSLFRFAGFELGQRGARNNRESCIAFLQQRKVSQGAYKTRAA